MRRRAIYIPGLVHENPIPVACRNGPQLVTGLIHPSTPGTHDVPDDIAERVANLWDHMAAILEAADATWDDITKISFYVTDNSTRAAINARWVEQFPDEATRPARHTTVTDVRHGVACEFLAYVE